MTRMPYNGDPREYLGATPEGERRYYVYCQATEHRDGVVCQCSCSNRQGDFNNNLGRSILHQCTMKDSIQKQIHQRRLDDFRDRHRTRDEPIMNPIVKEVAIFIGQSNLSVNAACNGDLRSLLMTVFKAGWEDSFARAKPEARSDSILGNSNPLRDKATEAGIPRWNPELIRKALESIHQEMRSELISIFREYPDVRLSIDGVTIKSRSSLKIDLVNPVPGTLPLTHPFFF
jgi:hypothetical protein